jgi:divalent metal cation (Fe/Co/Zn/Cd) transporter
MLLPFWVTIGRAIITGGGWGMHVSALLSALLFAGLAVIYHYTTRLRTDITQVKRLPVVDTVFLLTIYVSSFLHGFFFEDMWDSGDRISVAAKISGMSHSTADSLSYIMMFISMIAVVSYILYCGSKIKKLGKE